MKLINTLAVVTVGFSTMAAAQSERDLGSHEHGSAFLNVAVLDDSVILELETPWNNLTGFEHQPRTDAQHALINDALARLNQPGELFAFAGTNCVATETVIENSLELSDHDEHEEEHDEHKDHDEHEEEHNEHKEHDEHEEEHDEHKDHDEHEEEHDEHKDHDEHEEEHDEHSEHDDAENTHSGLLVSYSFNCDDITQLETIDVKLLEIWPGFKELDVQLIGPGGQDALELSPQQTLVDITRAL